MQYGGMIPCSAACSQWMESHSMQLSGNVSIPSRGGDQDHPDALIKREASRYLGLIGRMTTDPIHCARYLAGFWRHGCTKFRVLYFCDLCRRPRSQIEGPLYRHDAYKSPGRIGVEQKMKPFPLEPSC